MTLNNVRTFKFI